MKYSKHSYQYSYIYKLTLKDQSTYVGLRHCNCLPEKDSYLGSGRAYQKENVVRKDILISGNFDDKTLAILETIAIMDDKANNPKNLNRNLGAYQFNQYCLSRFDEDGHKLMQQRANERWSNPETRSKLEYARKHQMEGNDVKERISETVRKTCSDLNWKLKHSKAIKEALSKKKEDPDWVKKNEEIQRRKSLKARGRKKPLTEKTKDFFNFKKNLYHQNKDIFNNWNEFQTFIKGIKTEQEILAILKTIKR